MANLLKMTVVQSILSLHSQGWSNRRIALALSINRRTVGRYVRQHQASGSKCTSAPIEPARLVADSKCTSAPTGPGPPIEMAPSDPSGTGAARSSPTSRCAAWRDFILARREQGLTAKRIHQDLLAEPGTEQISYDSVRRFLKRLGARINESKIEAQKQNRPVGDPATGISISARRDIPANRSDAQLSQLFDRGVQ